MTLLTVYLSSEKAQNPAQKHFEKTKIPVSSVLQGLGGVICKPEGASRGVVETPLSPTGTGKKPEMPAWSPDFILFLTL